jgi:glycerol-3-phosphate dehydrogenase
MWNEATREALWAQVAAEPWDLIVVGGGITGAGVLREAARRGLRALLVEQRDFAWGASSRSSKLVHGGLRYLAQLQLGVTRDSVRERERLLREAPGLVEPLGFALAAYRGEGPGLAAYAAALAVYDGLGGRRDHRRHRAAEFALLAPGLADAGLAGGMTYGDAQTDDARLVLRLLREAAADGAAALSYVGAEGLVREAGRVRGVRLRDGAGREAEARAAVVVNATGPWADRLRGQLGKPPVMRPLRGSHLVFPAWRLPAAQAISFPHPDDRRPVFACPWEGATIVGTTDVDHGEGLAREPRIAPAEAAYLLDAVARRFPALGLTAADVIATWAGVRPVVGSGAADPSKESRDHVVWAEDGLLTVTGGKLTTFRLLAREALRAAAPLLPAAPAVAPAPRAFDAPPPLPAVAGLDAARRRRLAGRYGAEAAAVVAAARPGELEPIAHTATLWAELRWAARAEGVRHLDDLLLRRTRLGLLLPAGGTAILPGVAAICAAELGWDAARWEAEAARYRRIWDESYSMPGA